MSENMNRFILRTVLPVLLQFFAIAGLFTVHSYAAEPCKDIIIIQDGVPKKAINGNIQIKRLPFTIRYRGQEKYPSITLSLTSELNQKLQASGRSRLLASAGDYMALYPNDLVLLDEFSLFENREGRNAFAGLIGEGYADLVEKVVSENPELSLATGIPKASSGFIYNQADKGHDYLINKISTIPVSQTGYKTLYLTYFNVLDELSPLPEQESNMKLLQVVSWGSCTITFK